ncbi:MAG TPA: hypothetical protein VFN75_07005 [Pseudonocardiaceae bacterium]|nr:hypothetical protein [Pseudonocardiaceae bacterium]
MHTLLSAVSRVVDATPLGRPVQRYLSDVGLLDAVRPGRQVWYAEDRVHLEVPGVDQPGSEELADEVERQLHAVPGVHRAEVNAVLGRVVVHCDRRHASRTDLVNAIEEAERAHPATHGSGPAQPLQHPSDPRPLAWEIAVLVGQLAGAALSVTGRIVRFPRLPTLIPAAVSLADHTPQLRQALEERVGPAGTDMVFALGGAAAHGLAQRPLALLVEAAHRLSMLTEAYAQQQAWQRREPELGVQAGDHRVRPLERPPRPAPMPPGPVEHYGQRQSPPLPTPPHSALPAATIGPSACCWPAYPDPPGWAVTRLPPSCPAAWLKAAWSALSAMRCSGSIASTW